MIISTIYAAADLTADRIAKELAKVPEEMQDRVLEEVVRHVVRHNLLEETLPRGASWGSLAVLEQEEIDQRYVRMTQSEFDQAKQRAKRERWFSSWSGWRDWVEKISSMRRVLDAPIRPPVKTRIDSLLDERREYIYNGRAIFNSEAAMVAAVRDIEQEIVALGGADALAEDGTDLNTPPVETTPTTSPAARVRQARAVKSCRRFIAARIIQKLVRRVSSTRRALTLACDLCGDEIEHKNVYETPKGGLYCSLECSLYARGIRPVWR